VHLEIAESKATQRLLMASSNISWAYPAWGDLNLTSDCSLYAQFFSSISRDGLLNAPLGATVNYFLSAMPKDFSPQPTLLQIVELWQAIVANYTNGVGNVEMFNSVYDAAQGVCHDEFCAAIGFQGNADLAGKGVSSAFT
jgi:hypothetical protein